MNVRKTLFGGFTAYSLMASASTSPSIIIEVEPPRIELVYAYENAIDFEFLASENVEVFEGDILIKYLNEKNEEKKIVATSPSLVKWTRQHSLAQQRFNSGDLLMKLKSKTIYGVIRMPDNADESFKVGQLVTLCNRGMSANIVIQSKEKGNYTFVANDASFEWQSKIGINIKEDNHGCV
ncbi:hypothetical protein HUZ36_12755 [Pseudoalteromonas sp. McH1-7]|nr:MULTISPECIES: hypothetical protein [Pseudoalteromonas]MDW7550981.1 hypothetical protein [Pseudoalteromonas peptidolytica]NLR15229.1 hypothetical protein [Pseudoalteromonas peptidolytica]NUZ11649.1 hypothetical protein [Pseudoalteromonas sp. McH1-7]RXE94940.1 hypothetical protein D9603_21185 [Pseudoalteromonas sp. PS5]USD28507.1 hypothetical protein J8Z24_16615 [Pseudoalteromonas sp. SCSIO 43201]